MFVNVVFLESGFVLVALSVAWHLHTCFYSGQDKRVCKWWPDSIFEPKSCYRIWSFNVYSPLFPFLRHYFLCVFYSFGRHSFLPLSTPPLLSFNVEIIEAPLCKNNSGMEKKIENKLGGINIFSMLSLPIQNLLYLSI